RRFRSRPPGAAFQTDVGAARHHDAGHGWSGRLSCHQGGRRVEGSARNRDDGASHARAGTTSDNRGRRALAEETVQHGRVARGVWSDRNGNGATGRSECTRNMTSASPTKSWKAKWSGFESST